MKQPLVPSSPPPPPSGVPVLGVEPQLANLYSTHSGRTKLFAAAGVAIPPSAEEVHSLEQLVEQLSMLVTAHLAVRRWLFKIDHYPGGKGFGEQECTIPMSSSPP